MENTIIQKKNIELKSCNDIKNVLMILVVFYHCCLMFTSEPWEFSFTVEKVNVIHYIKYFFMPILTRTFFMVCGYIYAFLKLEKKQYSSYSKFILNKFLRLLVPFFFIGLFITTPVKCALGLVSIKDGILNILLGGNADQLWFLRALFWMFVIVYPLDKFFDKYPIISILLSFACMGLSPLMDLVFTRSLGLTSTFKNIAFFVLGYMYRKYSTNIIRSKKFLIPSSLLYIVLFSAHIILKEIGGDTLPIIGEYAFYPLYIIGSSIAFGLLLNLFEKIKISDNRIPKFIGKHSMNIYLFHQQFIYLFIILLINKINPYLFVILTFICVLVLSILTSMLFRSNKVTRFLIGSK